MSIEYFKIYLYGKYFSVIKDHKALLSILKENRSIKSCNSCLTRWLDRIYCFNFIVNICQGINGVDGLRSKTSKSKKLKKIYAYDEKLRFAKLDLISTSVNSLNLHISQSASPLHTLLKVHELAPQITTASEPAEN